MSNPPSLLTFKNPATKGFVPPPKPKAKKLVPSLAKKKPLKTVLGPRVPGPIPGTDILVTRHPTNGRPIAKVVYSKTSKAVDPQDIAAYKASISTGQATPDPKTGKLKFRDTRSVRQRIGSDEANTLSLGGLADRVSRGVVGPNITNAVEGKSFSPYMLPVEVAGVFPFGRAARIARLAGELDKSVGAGYRGAEAVRVAHAASLLPRNPAPLEVRVGENLYRGPASRSPITRTVQRGAVKLAQHKIDTNPLGPEHGASQGIASKVVSHLNKASQFAGNIRERAPAEALAGHTLRTPRDVAVQIIHGQGVTSPRQMALKLVAEDSTPDAYIKMATEEIAKKKLDPHHFADVAKLKRNIKLAETAKKYLNVVPAGKAGARFASSLPPEELTSVLKPATSRALRNLHNQWESIAFVNEQRLAAKLRMGDVTAEQAANRQGLPRLIDQGVRMREITEPVSTTDLSGSVLVNGRPGRVVGHSVDENGDTIVNLMMHRRGNAKDYPASAPIGEVEKVVGHRFEWPDGTPVSDQELQSGGRVFVKSTIGHLRGAGKPQTQSEMLPFAPQKESTEPYTGRGRTSGLEDINTTHVVGSAALVAQRRDRFLRDLGPLQKIAVRSAQAPSKGKWVPARLVRNMSAEERSQLDAALYKSDHGITLSRDEANTMDKLEEQWVKNYLPEDMPADPRVMNDYGWVPESMVGDLKKPFIIQNQSYGKAVDGLKYVAGSLNDIVKATLIYAKFGYVAPNLAGNLALNVFQQGPALLPTMKTVFHLSATDTPVSHLVDSYMGSGVMKSFLSGDRRVTQRVLGTLAHVQSVPTDRYTRRASFWYELGRETGIGFSDSKALAARLRQMSRAAPGSADAHSLEDVILRSRNAAIEYERMTQAERKFIASWFFIYPWMKGASKYSVMFPFEHPVQAAALWKAWDLNEARNKRMIANYKNRPPWQEHITAVGGTPGNPTVSNWGTILPMTSAEDVAKATMAIFQGHPPGFAEGPATLVNPGLVTLEEALHGRNPDTGTALKGNPWLAAAEDFLGQSAAYGDFFPKPPKPSSPTQRSRVQHLVHAFLGSPSPTTIAPRNFTKKKSSSRKPSYSGGSSYSGDYSRGSAYAK